MMDHKIGFMETLLWCIVSEVRIMRIVIPGRAVARARNP